LTSTAFKKINSFVYFTDIHEFPKSNEEYLLRKKQLLRGPCLWKIAQKYVYRKSDVCARLYCYYVLSNIITSVHHFSWLPKLCLILRSVTVPTSRSTSRTNVTLFTDRLFLFIRVFEFRLPCVQRRNSE